MHVSGVWFEEDEVVDPINFGGITPSRMAYTNYWLVRNEVVIDQPFPFQKHPYCFSYK